MIDIHCQAAMAHDTPEGYPSAMKWLMCAQSHDRTNSEIHHRIAERSYLHAVQVSGRGQTDDAMSAIENCLYYDRDHEAAKGLKADLLRREASADDPTQRHPGSEL